jgi:hypothetical protein
VEVKEGRANKVHEGERLGVGRALGPQRRRSHDGAEQVAVMHEPPGHVDGLPTDERAEAGEQLEADRRRVRLGASLEQLEVLAHRADVGGDVERGHDVDIVHLGVPQPVALGERILVGRRRHRDLGPLPEEPK